MTHTASFSTGGYVLHGLRGQFNGKISAWYSKDGRLLDAEQTSDHGITRPVRKGGPLWSHVARQSRIYAPIL